MPQLAKPTRAAAVVVQILKISVVVQVVQELSSFVMRFVPPLKPNRDLPRFFNS